jgi:hypothetical protein
LTILHPALDQDGASPSASGSLYGLVYRSHSLVPAARAELELAHILRAARAKNMALGITGALMFYGGWFAQALEGPEAAVRTLFARISADPRHNGIEVIDEGRAVARVFERWAMAYVGEHGEPDTPMIPVENGLAPGAAWRPRPEQQDRLELLRQATRGYGRGA